MQEPLCCDDVEFNVTYNIPTTAKDSLFPVDVRCRELNGALNFTIWIDPNKTNPEKDLVIENS